MSNAARAAVLGVLLALSVRASELDPEAWLKRADAPHDAFHEGVIHVRIRVAEAGKEVVESTMDLFVKGTSRALCVFREGKQQGRKILTAGDKVWLIVPTATRPVPVSKGQRLLGAASFGDIARIRFADEYDATLRPEEEPVREPGGETACRVLDLKAKRKESAYAAGVLWVGKDDGLARKLRVSLASGKEAKEVLFTAYPDKPKIGTMEIRDLLASKGESVTTLVFESYAPKALADAMFEPEGARAVP